MPAGGAVAVTNVSILVFFFQRRDTKEELKMSHIALKCNMSI